MAMGPLTSPVRVTTQAPPGRWTAGIGARNAAPVAPMAAAAAYRKQARRLRAEHAGDPEKLQKRLADLSRRHDRASQATALGGPSQPSEYGFVLERDRVSSVSTRVAAHARPLDPIDRPDAKLARAVVDWFAERAAEACVGPLLHHSQRRDLLKTARRLGIGRFHANLLIAVAQHEASLSPRPTAAYRLSPRKLSPTAWAVLAALQALIAFGAWRVLYG